MGKVHSNKPDESRGKVVFGYIKEVVGPILSNILPNYIVGGLEVGREDKMPIFVAHMSPVCIPDICSLAAAVFYDHAGEFPAIIGYDELGSAPGAMVRKAAACLEEVYSEFIIVGVLPPLFLFPPIHVFYGHMDKDSCVDLCVHADKAAKRGLKQPGYRQGRGGEGLVL